MSMNVNFYEVTAKDGQTAAERYAAMTKDDNSFYSVGSDLYLGSVKLSNASDLATAVANIAQNAADIVTINTTLTKLEGAESVSGSIRAIVKTYLEGLDGSATIASKANDIVTIKAGITEADGVVSNDTGADIVLAKVASTGDSEDVSYDNTTSGLTATDIQAAIDEVAEASAGGVGSKTVYLQDASAGQSDYAKVYKLYQGSDSSDMTQNTLVGTMNIPKDMVVQSGSVKTVTTADEPYAGAEVGDKYIELVIQNQANPLYIPVKDLVDVYTGSTGTEITVAIDANNQITASIVAMDGSKLVAGSVAKGKLATAVQASLDLADSAVQSVAEGATAGTIAVDGTDVAVHGLATVATSGDSADVAYGSTNVDAALDDIYSQIGQGGSVAEQIQDAIEALDTASDVAIATNNSGVVTLSGSVKEVDGVIAKGTASDVTLAKVATTGAATDVTVADTDSNFTSTTKNVENILAEISQHLTWQEV